MSGLPIVNLPVKEKDTKTYKVGIKHENNIPIMYELDNTLPLSTLLKDICGKAQIILHEKYCLYCEDNDQFLTETSRELHDGSVLELRLIPELAADQVIEALRNNDEKKAFVLLKNQLKNATFASIFVAKGGLPYVLKFVQESAQSGTLGFALQMFQELMDHGPSGWESLSDEFVQKVASSTEHQNLNVKKRALAVCERLLNSPIYGYARVSPFLRLENIAGTLENASDLDTQTNALSVLNATLLTAPTHVQTEVLNKLLALGLRRTLITLVHKIGGVSDELAHELYVFQTVWLNTLQARFRTPFNKNNPQHNEMLQEVLQKGFENDQSSAATNLPVKRLPNSLDPQLKNFGFESEPTVALQQPPGILALENILYFARTKLEIFQKIISEQASRGAAQCPFAKSSISLTLLLFEVLQIGTAPSEHNSQFLPVIFSSDHPFEEMFGLTIQLMIRTWREMDATGQDFEKVLKVVKKQLAIVFAYKPESQPQSVDAFRTALFSLSYKAILAQQEKEMAEKEYVHHRAEPVRQLKEQIQRDLVQLVGKQRISYLVEGAFFPKYTSKGRQKGSVWYCKLSSNHKMLLYGDTQEGKVPPIEALPGKINLSEVKALCVGKDSPLLAKMKKSNDETAALAFSLLLENEESLDFVAPNRAQFFIWADSLRILLGQQPESANFNEDVDTLLSMAMKLRLLHVENVQIPDKAPIIPPVPKFDPNTDLGCDFSQ